MRTARAPAAIGQPEVLVRKPTKTRREVIMMTSKDAKGPSKAESAPGTVSLARLQQKTGSANAFGGYEKVKHSNNTFTMRTTKK